MRTKSAAIAAFALTVLLLLHGMAASAAEIKLIAVGPLTALFRELGPQFERETGHTLVTRFGSAPAVKRMIDAGDTFDLAISIPSSVDGWIKEGKIAAPSRAAVAYAGVGVAVRSGAPKPDISTVEASKRALLNAKSVTHGSEGASADYLKGLLERLGIADEMKPKLKPMVTAAALKSVAAGEVEIVIFSVPTLAATTGIDLVGPFPAELQVYIRFIAGVSASTNEPEAARALVKFLATPVAIAVMKAKGIEPGAPR